MKITFVGDIMLGRRIKTRFSQSGESILDDAIRLRLKEADFIVGNLESPIVGSPLEDSDHLQFQGHPMLLKQFSFLDCCILANNHINDFGENGIDETIAHLDNLGIPWNGVYQQEYTPHVFEIDGRRFALFSCTDMMNEELADNASWSVGRVDDPCIDAMISDFKERGHFVILYAHVGMLFSRYPNPLIRDLMHKKVVAGADLIVTLHPHVVGGMEVYRGVPIIYSLGDFVMDGSSDRRRRSVILEVDIDGEGKVIWDVVPARISSRLGTELARGGHRKKVLRSWTQVSKNLGRHSSGYARFFRRQYRIEMVQHIASTFWFLLRSRGIGGTVRLIFKRSEEVIRLRKWATQDRSHLRMDDDVISKDRKRFSTKEIFRPDED